MDDSSSSDDDVMLLGLAAQLGGGSTRRNRYMNEVHDMHGKTRFRTFDEYRARQDDGLLVGYIRVTNEEFEEILHRIEGRIRHQGTHRHPIQPHHRLCVFLRFVGHGSSFASLGHEFNIGKYTAAEIVHEVAAAIVDEMSSEELKGPDADWWARSAKGFAEVWKYPRAVAAMDGKHIRIQAPSNSGSLYFNYKNYFSLVLLAVVDCNYQLMLFDLGGEGRQSDAGLYNQSKIKPYLEYASHAEFPEARRLGRFRETPYAVLVDQGFPLTEFLMRPFQVQATVDPAIRLFNERLSSARRISENFFGILQSRFRIFQKPIIMEVPRAKRVITSILNFLNRRASHDQRQRWIPPDVPTANTTGMQPLGYIMGSQARDSAKKNRDNLVDFFASEAGIRRSRV